MTNNNEMVTVDVNTGEMILGEEIVRETENYQVVKLPNGKFKKNMKYPKYWSVIPVTDEGMVRMYNILNDTEGNIVIPMKNMIGKEIDIKHVFINPYTKFDEETGNNEPGVNITIESTDGSIYATSSKSVYFRLMNMFETFGRPSDKNYKPIKVKVFSTKQANGMQNEIAFVGLVN